MEQKTIIWVHMLVHDETVQHGMYFLSRQINQAEAKVFFDEAFYKGSAVFEDHLGSKFKLVHKGGEYNLIKA